jgi:excisionase family DNA binding protein
MAATATSAARAEQFLTIPQVAKLLGIGRTTVYDLISTQRIAVHNVTTAKGVRMRVSESDLAAYQASIKVPALKPRGRAA